jgi:hypothetical protein
MTNIDTQETDYSAMSNSDHDTLVSSSK